MKKRITLYVDADVWREFRVKCVLDDVSASALIEEYMRERIGKPLPDLPIPFAGSQEDGPTKDSGF